MLFSRFSRLSRRTARISLVLLLLPAVASAQWPADPSQNLPVCTVPGWRATDPVSCTDGAGGVLIAWEDERNLGIYAQRVNAEGTPLWVADGVPVTGLPQTPGDHPAAIVSDGSGGAILTFYRATQSVAAQRINGNGVTQWPSPPVVIGRMAEGLRACTDGAGGVILAWYDFRLGAGTPRVFVQRITAAGVPQWTADGVAVSGTDGWIPVIVADGLGGAIVTWSQLGTAGIRAQRINALGALQWGANGALVSSLGGIGVPASLAPDGTGGAIFGWQDGTSSPLRVYAQRVSPSGVPQWPGGVLLFSDPVGEGWWFTPLTASDGAGGAIVAWAFWDGLSFGDYDLLAQRISPAGTPLWPAGGVSITGFMSSVATVASDGIGGAVFAWVDGRLENRQLYAQRIDDSGTVLWGGDGVGVRIWESWSLEYAPAPVIGDGAAIFAWEDPRPGGGDYDVYAQLVRFSGLLGTPQVTINEIRTGRPSDLGEEYIELMGAPGASLDGLSYVVIGNGPGGCGIIESVINLNGFVLPGDGIWAAARRAAPTVPGNYDVGGMLMNFEEGNNVTHLLVSGYNGAPPGTDVDLDDDALLDPGSEPWDFMVDRVALTTRVNDPDCATAEFVYSPVRAGPDGASVPGHVFRCPGTDSWGVGPFDPVGGIDTPGNPNGACLAVLGVSRTPLVPTVGEPVTVTALVGTALPMRAVELICRVDGGAENVCSVMTDDGGGYWSGTLDSQPTAGTLVEYYVRARSTEPVQAASAYEGYLVGAIPIAAARDNDPNGVNVNVGLGVMVQGNITVAAGNFASQGQALTASSTGTDYYVQDATGGINVFQAGVHPVQPALGDLVTVIGTLAQVAGRLMITGGGSLPDLQVTVNGSGAPPTPQVITPCELSEATEGLLVKVQNAHLAAPPGTTLEPDTAYPLTDCAPDVVSMYVDGDTNIDGTELVTNNVDVTGICVQSDPTSPYTAGYQIVPRSNEDLVPAGVTAVRDPMPVIAPHLAIGRNPVLGRTTIAFRIPARGRTAIRIVDVGGRLIQTLVDGDREAGEWQLEWVPVRLPAGVYWLRLETPTSVLSRRLIVMH